MAPAQQSPAQGGARPQGRALRAVHTRPPRVPLSARVMRYDGGPAAWNAINLSEGGLFVAGTPVLPPRTKVELGLWLPGGDADIEIVAGCEVVWTNERSRSVVGRELPAGMGLRFLRLDSDDRRTIGSLVARHQRERANTPDAEKSEQIAGLINSAINELGGSDTGDFDVLPRDRAFEAGQVVGSYRIMEQLGAGGMGDVYLAEHVQLARKVALKRLQSVFTRDPVAVRRFFAEARLVNEIRHDNIVEITDFVSDGTNKYFVMELLRGATLAHLMTKLGVVPIRRALAILVQLCGAVEAVHRAGIVHRDLKPDNVMLIERDGHTDYVKLLDFGIAKLRDPQARTLAAKTAAGVVVGTPGYMSPEQLLGKSIDHRSDIYALGALMYEMVTGRRPFVGDTWADVLLQHATETPVPPSNLSKAGDGLPAVLEKLILQCLEKEPERRPQNAGQVREQLSAILAAEMTGKRVRRLRTKRAFYAGLSLVVPVVGLSWYMLRPSEPSPRVNAPAPVARQQSEARPAVADSPARAAALDDHPAPREDDVEPRDRSSLRAKKRAAPLKSEVIEVPAAKVSLAPMREAKPRSEPDPSVIAEPVRASAPAPAAALTESAASQHYEAARRYLAENKALLAVEALTKCLTLDPSYAKAYRALGQAYAALGRQDRAVEALQRYLELAPASPDAAKIRRIIDDYKHGAP